MLPVPTIPTPSGCMERAYGIGAVRREARPTRPAPMPYRRAMRHDQIALQLYTVRRELAADLPGTLRAVAGAGYASVELAGLPPVEPVELGQLLGDAGLRPVASHEGIDALRADPAGVAARLRRFGCPRAIVPWLPEDDRGTADDVRRFAAELGGIAAELAKDGVRLGYHNHAFEFAALDGTTVWDVLVAELPAGVELEVDVYWASVGGRDPAEVIRACRDRVRLVHLKDRSPGTEPHDAPAGEGTLDLTGIIAAARAAGVEWYVAEQDEPADALLDVATARRNLSALAD
jgi:sugar phosphate isomerase/epimerase